MTSEENREIVEGILRVGLSNDYSNWEAKPKPPLGKLVDYSKKETMNTQTPLSLYDRDFYLWLETTAQLLKDKKFSELDLENLIEEIESMGRSEKRELKSRLTVLLMHLLKWNYQQDMRSNSWKSTIVEQRYQIKLLLDDSPSLKNLIFDVIPDCYESAVLKAVAETGLSKDTFPDKSPFSLSEIFVGD